MGWKTILKLITLAVFAAAPASAEEQCAQAEPSDEFSEFVGINTFECDEGSAVYDRMDFSRSDEFDVYFRALRRPNSQNWTVVLVVQGRVTRSRGGVGGYEANTKAAPERARALTEDGIVEELKLNSSESKLIGCPSGRVSRFSVSVCVYSVYGAFLINEKVGEGIAKIEKDRVRVRIAFSSDEEIEVAFEPNEWRAIKSLM